jgi:hypothetical protein
MKYSLVAFFALIAGAVAFVPQSSRAMSRVAARSPVAFTPAPKTVMMMAADADDVEKSLTRTGLLVGLGLPILVAPYSGSSQATQCSGVSLTVYLSRISESFLREIVLTFDHSAESFGALGGFAIVGGIAAVWSFLLFKVLEKAKL